MSAMPSDITVALREPATRRARPPKYRQGRTVDGYKIESLLAQHDLSETYSARGPRNEHVVIKTFLVNGRDEAFASFTTEVNVATHLHHPNVLEFLYVEPRANYYVTPFCKGGTLAQWLQKRVRLANDDSFAILHQFADVLRCAHANKIIVGDISPYNILMHSKAPLAVKVIDFGEAKMPCPRLSCRRFRFTAQYAAPERFQSNSQPTPEGDRFSFAPLAAEVITGIPLLEVDPDTGWPVGRNEKVLPLVEQISPDFHATLLRLLSKTPKARPDFDEVLKALESVMFKHPSIPPRERQFTK